MVFLQLTTYNLQLTTFLSHIEIHLMAMLTTVISHLMKITINFI